MCIGGGAERQEAGQHEMQLAQMAQQEVNYWKKGGFKDLENAAILDAKKAGSENKTQIARGKSHVAAVRGMQLPQTAQNPNGGVGKVAGMGALAGDILARSSNDADLAQRTKSKAGLVDMAQFGRGQQAVGVGGLKSVAGMESQTNATNLALKKSSDSFNAELVGSLAGMAAGSMGGGGKPASDGLGTWDNAKNTVTGADGLTMDMGTGSAPGAWDMTTAKMRTMFQ